MLRRVYTGIDIGTYHVKVAIAAAPESADGPLHVIGTGTAVSRGLRHGYIVDSTEATKCIKEALERAQGNAKVKVHSASVAIGGVGLDELRATGEVTLTPSGGVVTERDIERVLRESEKRSAPRLINRTIVHTLPLEYRVDGNKVLGTPEGLQGAKLSVDTLLVTMLEKHHDDLMAAVEATGIEVEHIVASPIAASLTTLTKAQRSAGVALANIGSETLSIIVFDNDVPISVKIFPIGSNEITHSLALSFQIPLSDAEQMKRGTILGSDIPSKKMQHVVHSRVKDMFTLIAAHLKTIGRHQLLPAGIVLTGGGSSVMSGVDIARAVLKIPSQVGLNLSLRTAGPTDASWAVAYGLCRWAFYEDIQKEVTSFRDVFRDAWAAIKQFGASLLP